uniref:Uncharacterized protein n=1 Tax=Picea glauca TaxID=3330 RepID=A0A101LZM6_PICGL|nr:hypothetical protein ABT39_MTgene5194 [Picea glauca]QHR91174.1 hypothetical protein Q903MT_gene5206 [Picea sitchensis]
MLRLPSPLLPYTRLSPMLPSLSLLDDLIIRHIHKGSAPNRYIRKHACPSRLMLQAEVNAIIPKYISFRFDVMGPSFLYSLSGASYLESVTFP